ncbi:recombinase family protein [Streptomyces flavotricini]|uniref:Recombinase family protein n=1 Tax=Streptomyces flavotricini TaxID=66888 RepID=A0ABS8EIP2_9ACTN|nr:recombinase family protein [Streptomyces flavotricini]MCC0100723.1 recombinase family protein [Streptomyces flavotricini]
MQIPTQMRHHRSPSTAAYLRCYPYDATGMPHHHWALGAYARHRNLPLPIVYFDNGRRSHRPEFERLIRSVAGGWHNTVLIPGPWVFDLHPEKAEDRLRELTAYGCRIVELPRPPW